MNVFLIYLLNASEYRLHMKSIYMHGNIAWHLINVCVQYGMQMPQVVTETCGPQQFLYNL